MKVNFFRYCLRQRRVPKASELSFDLPGVLSAFADFDHVPLKNSFVTDDGEHVFLLRAAGSKRCYMFISTRSQEIIKAINGRTGTAADIRAKLDKGEDVGFATYMQFEPEFYVVASTMRGPKNGTFVRFVNQLLRRLDVENFNFAAIALGTKITRQELKRLALVTQVHVEVTPSNPMGQAICGFLHTPGSSVRTIKVSIVAKHKDSIEEEATEVADRVEDLGLSRFRVRAKAAIQDDLADYFLTDDGQLSAQIEANTEDSIVSQLMKTVRDKGELAERLIREPGNEKRHEEAARFDLLDRFSEPAAWDRAFPPDWAPPAETDHRRGD